MAAENQKTVLGDSPAAAVQQNSSELPSDSELFAGAVQNNNSELPPDSELFIAEPPAQLKLSARQLFAGSENFYESLTGSAKTGVTQPTTTANMDPLQIAARSYRQFSNIQKILAACIVLIASILLYELLKSPSAPVKALPPRPAEQTAHTQQTATVSRQAPAIQQVRDSKLPVPDVSPIPSPQVQKPKRQLELSQSLSLKVARNFYLQAEYDKAYAVYDQLHRIFPEGTENQLVRDFLQLRMALCMEKKADFEQAEQLLRTVLQSGSPVVRALAYYRCSLFEMQKRQYLDALTRAYQAIALIDAVDCDRAWAVSLKRDCYFVIAEAVTRNVLLLSNADKNLPEDLWSKRCTHKDPFANLDGAQLWSFLKSGSQRLSRTLLEPEIHKLEHIVGFPRYTVICYRAPLEEVLSRFAANAGLDIHWALDSDEIGFRKRAVDMYLPAVTVRQFIAMAAGSAGLLAQLDNGKVINVFNPAKYSYTSKHISLLRTEAISLWREFLLKFHNDRRLADAHFALGLLWAQQDRFAESIAEYKLVANRFSWSSLAPYALLKSSKLKTRLRDYTGVSQDLKQLVEQYPDSEIACEAYLQLADITTKAGPETEAARLYRKVYHLTSSAQSKSTAALEAGRCFYRLENYQSAEKWLTRYIELAGHHKAKDLSSAYFLLGKTNLALGKPKVACDAFRYALAGEGGKLSEKEYAEAVSALVQENIEQKHFIQALAILEDACSVATSQKESIEILLLKSRTFRAMGLVDKAIAEIGGTAEHLSDNQLKAGLNFELAQCYIAKGQLERAHRVLAETLVVVETGPLAHEIAACLADVCLKVGRDSQVVSVCSQLLKLQPEEQIKQKALDLLAAAYNRQKNYDKAALALLGRWNNYEEN